MGKKTIIEEYERSLRDGEDRLPRGLAVIVALVVLNAIISSAVLLAALIRWLL